MTSIKKISGEILLYFYILQRQDVGKLKSLMLNFRIYNQLDEQNGAKLDRRDGGIFGINDFKDYTDNDIYNALVYLYDSGLIDFNDSRDNTGSNLINLKVTSGGIDIVENIDKGSKEKAW